MSFLPLLLLYEKLNTPSSSPVSLGDVFLALMALL